MHEHELRERLRKIEALFAGAATPGERDAAEAALNRVKARLAEQQVKDPPVELQFSMGDQWMKLLFTALCRRYGLKPYRYYRQKRTTVMVRVPQSFCNQILWPEFEQLSMVLRDYLQEVTARLIHEHVHGDTSEAEEIAGMLPSS